MLYKIRKEGNIKIIISLNGISLICLEIKNYKIEIGKIKRLLLCTLYVEGEFLVDRLDQFDVNPEEKIQQGNTV